MMRIADWTVEELREFVRKEARAAIGAASGRLSSDELAAAFAVAAGPEVLLARNRPTTHVCKDCKRDVAVHDDDDSCVECGSKDTYRSPRDVPTVAASVSDDVVAAPAEPARLDADRTAQPKSRIVMRPPHSRCWAAMANASNGEYVGDDGTRVPLDGAAPAQSTPDLRRDYDREVKRADAAERALAIRSGVIAERDALIEAWRSVMRAAGFAVARYSARDAGAVGERKLLSALYALRHDTEALSPSARAAIDAPAVAAKRAPVFGEHNMTPEARARLDQLSRATCPTCGVLGGECKCPEPAVVAMVDDVAQYDDDNPPPIGGPGTHRTIVDTRTRPPTLLDRAKFRASGGSGTSEPPRDQITTARHGKSQALRDAVDAARARGETVTVVGPRPPLTELRTVAWHITALGDSAGPWVELAPAVAEAYRANGSTVRPLCLLAAAQATIDGLTIALRVERDRLTRERDEAQESLRAERAMPHRDVERRLRDQEAAALTQRDSARADVDQLSATIARITQEHAGTIRERDEARAKYESARQSNAVCAVVPASAWPTPGDEP